MENLNIWIKLIEEEKALVSNNQAYNTLSKLGEAESKAKNLKNQAQEPLCRDSRSKEFQEESKKDHNGGRRHYYMEFFSLCSHEKLRLLNKQLNV